MCAAPATENPPPGRGANHMSSPNQAYPVSGVSPLIVGGTGTAIKVFPAVSASLPVNPAQPLPPGQLVGGPDRKSVVWGNSVEQGCRRII